MNIGARSWNRSFLFSSFIFWLMVAALAIYCLYPLRQKLKFGIDLVGGTYITLKVETNKAVEHELRHQSKRLLSSLKAEQSLVPTSYKIEENKIVFNFENSNDIVTAVRILRDNVSDLKLTQNGNQIFLEMTKDAISRLQGWALESNIEVLRTRLNKLGVEEIKITAHG